MQQQKKIIVIVGPTAVGKTAVAIELAKLLNTEIISADSRQCFTETTIGVAKPSLKELSEINHHFINSHSIHEDVNAGVYEKYALQKLDEIFTKKDTAIVVGGTGLYIKALCQGLDEIPAIDKNIQAGLIEQFEHKGLEWLQAEVQKNDNLYWMEGEQKNPQRLIRALAVKLSTHTSIIEFQKNKVVTRPFTIIKIGLNINKDLLHQNINKRVDQMINDGLIDEAKTLQNYHHLNALQTVGYKEIFTYLNGEYSKSVAIDLIKTHTRQYAKRQLTWFKKDHDIVWFEQSTPQNIYQFLKDKLL